MHACTPCGKRDGICTSSFFCGARAAGFIHNPIIRSIARISLPAILEEERARNFCRPVGIICMGERREGGGGRHRSVNGFTGGLGWFVFRVKVKGLPRYYGVLDLIFGFFLMAAVTM